MKKVIAACIDQILQFDSKEELERFLKGLECKKQLYTVVWENNLNDGIVQIRIRRQYNNHFMKEGEGLDEQK